MAFQLPSGLYASRRQREDEQGDAQEGDILRDEDDGDLTTPMAVLSRHGREDLDPATLPEWKRNDWHIATIALHQRFKAAEDMPPERVPAAPAAHGQSPFWVPYVAAFVVGLPDEYQEFKDVFSDELAGILPANTVYDHPIELVEGKQPPNLSIYNLSQKELLILREYIDKAILKGWIRPSKSPCGAPILFVPKSDSSIRLYVNYRGLNNVTIKDRYPLPLISEMLDCLRCAVIFTKLDLRDAYYRLRIRKGDEWKTAFKTRYGHFEYLVMPFGLANAPATFQSYINQALGSLVDTICVVYLDDILIYSKDEGKHAEHVKEVLRMLRAWKLYAKPSKCVFHTTSTTFLGFVVTLGGVVIDEERVRCICE